MMNHRNLKIFIIAVLSAGLTGCHINRLQDIDGNTYNTVTVGSQTWMKENLRTARYYDGTPIPLVTDYDSWVEMNTPSFCWYNNDPANKDVYGALYNWYAVDTKKLCPEGWHVPADFEWTELVYFLDGPDFAGGKLKEAGTSRWRSPNSEATNESGFTALPGGYRSYNGSFNYLGISGYWWSSTATSETTVYFANLRYKSGNVYRNMGNKANGFSVRCIKDQMPPE